MTEKDLMNLVTRKDLIDLENNIKNFISNTGKQDEYKEFYSVKEFANLVCLSYSTVLNYCNSGKIQATQEMKRGCWIIHKEELSRFKSQAELNTYSRQ